MILRSISDNIAVTLSDDLLWVDEHQWTPTVTTVSYSLTGSLLVESSVKKAGRPVTLQSEPDMGWVERRDVNLIYAWACLSGLILRLELKNQAPFNVMFRHGDGAVESAPVLGYGAYLDQEYYRLTLRLMQV